MSHTPHEIAEEFPEQVAVIAALKSSDAHFARLLEEYHALNREIHRAETGVTPTETLHENDMRKERLRLKDEIARRLQAA